MPTWLGFSEGFWGAIIGASIPVLAGIGGYLLTQKKENENKNVRTFSKINYELNKFIEMVNGYDYHLEEVAFQLKSNCDELVGILRNCNTDILNAKEVLLFYEILQIVDEMGSNACIEELIRDDFGQVRGLDIHANPTVTSTKIRELKAKRDQLLKDYL